MSNISNYNDFSANLQSEKEKLQKAKRSFTPNSDRQHFVRNSRTEYNPVTHKLTDYTEDEIDDKIKSIEELEEKNESLFPYGYPKEDQPYILVDIERDLMEMSPEEGKDYLEEIISFCGKKLTELK